MKSDRSEGGGGILRSVKIQACGFCKPRNAMHLLQITLWMVKTISNKRTGKISGKLRILCGFFFSYKTCIAKLFLNITTEPKSSS
jgi:hypothetical protein